MSDENKQKTTQGKFVKGDNYLVKQQITQPCEHKFDGAIKVAEYIVAEIQRNVKSKQAEQIRYYNDYSGRMKEWQKLPFLQRMGTTPKPMYMEAMATWSGMVKPNGAWDHKLKIRAKFAKYAVHRPLKKGTKAETWHHKYKSHDYHLDVWSNIHYGYVGLYCGFDEETLLKGAGLAQLLSDWTGDMSTLAAIKEFRDKKMEELDNPADQETIKVGFKLFKKYGMKVEKLKPEDVLFELENIPKKILQDSRLIHVCFDKTSRKYTED